MSTTTTWRAPWADLYPNQHPSPSCFWWSIANVWGSPNIQWCEENLCKFITQPANTWSNLAFVVSSIFMWWAAIQRSNGSNSNGSNSNNNNNNNNNNKKGGEKDDNKNDITDGDDITQGTLPAHVLRIMPWANFFMGFCSLVYHLSNVYPTQLLDFVGMFGTTTWACSACIVRYRELLRARNKLIARSGVGADDARLSARGGTGGLDVVGAAARGRSSSSGGGAKRRSASNKRAPSSSSKSKKSAAATTPTTTRSKRAGIPFAKAFERQTVFGLSAETLLFMGVVNFLQCIVVHIFYVSSIKFQLLVLLNVLAVIVLEFGWCRPAELSLLERFASVQHEAAGAVSTRKSSSRKYDVDGAIVSKVAGTTFSMFWFYVSLGCLVFAAFCNVADNRRWMCDPKNHFFQFHAAWHCFAAISMFAMWKHFALRS